MVSALGLLPLLAPGDTLVSAAVMGLAFAAALLSSALVLAVLRRLIPWSCHLVFILLITATSVTIIDRLLQAWLFQVRTDLGIYVPLIAVNPLLLSVLQETVLPQSPRQSLGYAAATAVAAGLLLAAAGLLRGLLGQAGLSLMGSAAGAFLVLGCLIALIRFLALRAGVTGLPSRP